MSVLQEKLCHRHFARYSGLVQLGLIVFANVRIFVGIFDQCAAFLYVDIDAVLAALVSDLKSNWMNAASVAQRKMARSLRPGVEMLMKSSPRRAVHAARFPF